MRCECFWSFVRNSPESIKQFDTNSIVALCARLCWPRIRNEIFTEISVICSSCWRLEPLIKMQMFGTLHRAEEWNDTSRESNHQLLDASISQVFYCCFRSNTLSFFISLFLFRRPRQHPRQITSYKEMSIPNTDKKIHELCRQRLQRKYFIIIFIRRNWRWDKFVHMLSADMWWRQFNNKIFSYLDFGYQRKNTILINQEMCFFGLVSGPSHCLAGK